MHLRSESNTKQIEREILADAEAGEPLGNRLVADFEHGQWWLTDLDTGAQWSVVDCETPDGREYFGFEQVTEGEEV